VKKIKYYGKLIEELQLGTKEEHLEQMPVILTQEDVPYLSEIFNFLNNKDKDILYLIFVSGKTQTDLVKILNRSQPSLSYDIKRIKDRIRFICFLHSQFSFFLEWINDEDNKLSPEEVMVLTLMYYTTSFSQSSRVSGLKPTRIRYVFDKALKKLKKIEPKIHGLFMVIRGSLNVVRRSYLRADQYWDNENFNDS
jgi:hypothetical protein